MFLRFLEMRHALRTNVKKTVFHLASLLPLPHNPLHARPARTSEEAMTGDLAKIDLDLIYLQIHFINLQLDLIYLQLNPIYL